MASDASATPGSRPRTHRARSTRRSVLWIDRLARLAISVGGMGTILAVMMVCVFLVWVVLPLFQGESLEPLRSVTLQASAEPTPADDTGSSSDKRPTPTADGHQIMSLQLDEYGNLGWLVRGDGTVELRRLEDGNLIAELPLTEDLAAVATAILPGSGHFAVVSADGQVQLGQVRFQTEFLEAEQATAAADAIGERSQGVWNGAFVQLTPEGQYRLQRLTITREDPLAFRTQSPPTLIDLSVTDRQTVLAVLEETGVLHLAEVTRRKNLLTGKVTARLKQGTLSLDNTRRPQHLMLSGLGDAIYLIDRSGRLLRVDSRDANNLAFMEEVELLNSESAEVTVATFLNGKTSLVVGDSTGGLQVWFRTRPDDAQAPDAMRLVCGHRLSSSGQAVVALAPSLRSRMLAALRADGELELYHVTSEQLLARATAAPNSAAQGVVAMAPRDDLVAVADGRSIEQWEVDAEHPEISLHAILGRVWYEGYEAPKYEWQSSSGTDDFEEKFGLMPLIFGTLKGTVYSMLFGAPLAFLAAIYTSEFLHPRAKARIKPTIEIMASLPSVVLGFLGALFFAPLIEDRVPEVILLLVTIPFAYLLGAYLWQLLPRPVATRLKSYRLLFMFAALPAGIVMAEYLARPVELWLFAGDCKAWLDSQVGSGVGAWMFLALPTAAAVVVWTSITLVTPAMRRWLGDSSSVKFAVVDLLRFLASCGVMLAVAYGVSVLLTRFGWDPRGTFVDTYVQRNALVVGLMMGFAIIPIIYTISDDALSAVPESLRAGSLGAGATPWQTAIRVVIPTAMSGLFSAFMVGLGRAVGETMIVLMAAGNTPVMEWNIFNGFRTLSANIAVELPEVVADSTHYRMLFLAALTLFTITFLVNTVAEVVRQRFRKRAFQL